MVKRIGKTNITSIEAGLLEQREGERLGVTGGMKNDTLFYVDAQPAGAKETFAEIATPEGQGSKGEWKLGELTVDRLLRPRSAINLAPTKTVSGTSAEKGLLKKLMKRASGGKNVAPVAKVEESLPSVIETWSTEHPLVAENPRKKLRKAPGVTIPNEALESYRPEAGAHLAALEAIEAKESARKPRPQRVVPTHFQAAGSDMVERANFDLLHRDEVDEDVEEEEEMLEGMEFKKTVKETKKKTQTQRNKEARLKAERAAALQNRLRRKAMAVLDNPKTLLASLEAERESNKKDATMHAMKNKKVAGRILAPAPLFLQLPEEQAGSLRLLAPEGNALMERYRSFGERGLTEPVGALLPSAVLAKTKRGRKNGRYRDFIKQSHR